MRALILSTLPVEGPSARPRLYAYAPHLRAAGIEPVFAPLLSSKAARRFYAAGAAARGRRLAAAAAGALGRLGRLLTASRFDVVVVHRDLLPRGNREALALLRRSRVPIVYDFDDAVYLDPRAYVDAGGSSHKLMARGKDAGEVEDLAAAADIVLAGNETLAAWARERSGDVRVQPTPVDTARFAPRADPTAGASPLLGWIGSPTATYCLTALADALARARVRREFALSVVGAAEGVSIPGVDVRQTPWTLDGEAAAYAALDVGLYPLPDNAWTRGKCGYKALVYMASGVVPIVSPVGVNVDIVEDGVTGFHAPDDDAWVAAIHRLLGDAPARAEMAGKGRAFVRDRFSVEALAPGFVAAVRDAAESRG